MFFVVVHGSYCTLCEVKSPMLTEIDVESFCTCNSSSINAFKVIFHLLNQEGGRENSDI